VSCSELQQCVMSMSVGVRSMFAGVRVCECVCVCIVWLRVFLYVCCSELQ